MEKNMDCNIARDLMQLYPDGVLSEGSEKFLKGHLESCSACSEYMTRLGDRRREEEDLVKKQNKAFFKALKRRKYELIGFAAGIVLMILLILLGTVFDVKMLNKSRDVISTSPADYDLSGFRGASKLEIFPEKSFAEGKIKEYYYRSSGNLLYRDYCIFLDCSYSESEYDKETERLRNLKDKKQTLYSDDEAGLPVICAMLYDEGYEYAVLDEDAHEIRYIYLQNADRDKIPFEQSLLPKDYGWNGQTDQKGREAFSIYK